VTALTLNTDADVIELTRQICDIDSVSGNETALADALEAALRTAGHLEVSRDGDALIARTNLGRAKRVIIAGHIDTVPIADNLPVTRMMIEGKDVLWGRGTVDMKAGVAVQLKLALDIAEPNVDITWVFYDHEEVDAALNGLGRISRNQPQLLDASFAVLCEPSNSQVEGGCNGTMRVNVRTRGVKAHSARPWMGENAIHKAGELLTKLHNFEPDTVNVDGLDYRESLNAVVIAGGIATNVIADETLITVNYRFAPSKTVEVAFEFLEEFFEGYEIELSDSAAGARPGLDLPEAAAFVAATGSTPKPKYGWTDVARFSALGIPAVNFGPGDPNKAHADDEFVEVEQIINSERALRAWLTA